MYTQQVAAHIRNQFPIIYGSAPGQGWDPNSAYIYARIDGTRPYTYHPTREDAIKGRNRMIIGEDFILRG